MQKFISAFLVMMILAMVTMVASAQSAVPDFKAYLQGVSEYFQADPAEVQEVASYLTRTDEVPVAYMVARKAGVDPMVLAQARYDGAKWGDLLRKYGVGTDLFHVEVRGFVPSAVYQPILDKFPEEQPDAWATAPLTDRDMLNLANLIFIRDHYGYSMYRVMAMRDKGKGFPAIQSEAWAVAQGPEAKRKTAKAGF